MHRLQHYISCFESFKTVMTKTWQRSRVLFVAATAVLLCVFSNAANAADGTDGGIYQIGVAKVDVTPAYPIRLNGFGYRREESEGVTHQIWVKALAIGSDEEKPAILFTIDATGVRQTMIDKVATRLKDKAGVERDRIALTFTHTHTAPKLNGVCDTIFSSPIPPEHQAHIDKYDAEVTDALEKAALAALADRKPSRLEWAMGTVGFAANRRPGGGPVDHDLPVMVVRAVEDDAIRAIYTTYACHCVTLSNNKVSGDWAGFAQQAIERKHPGAIAMVSIGCGSDSNPASGVTGDNTAAAADQGAQIADEIERLLQGALQPVKGALATTYEHIDIPLNPVPNRDQLTAVAARGGPEGYNAEFQLAKLDRGEPLTTKLDYPIQTWAFGDSLAMVFLAGEVCVDYSLRLKEELDEKRVWLHGYSNDFCAYIPSERLLREGGYGGGAEVVYFALPNTLAPGLEEKIIAAVHRQVPPPFEGEGPRAASDDQPWPLEKALASIKVKPGFVVEVAAAEPLIADPVAIDFGPDGRLWVADMTDYTHGVDEEFAQTGTVRVLTDADGDGHYDQCTVFASGLRFPTDVKAWDRGVIVCDAPDVIYLEDTDGDGKADVRKFLLTGFETHNAQARVNSLRWGLDNWLYGSCGLFGGKIKAFTGREFDLGGRDFRFRPDTGELEAVTGKTQQGRARDDWGNWFGCENSSLLDHYPLDDHYLARNPRVAPPLAEVFVPAGGDPNQLHPISQPILYLLSGPPGRPTAVCGLDFYRDDLLGAEYSNNAFVCEPVNNLVHRRILSAHSATFRGARGEDESDVEFCASTDPWFRPVQVRTGLDGCLYIVDMHRAVIEHPKWIPEETLRGLEVFGGRDQGRIYRVRRADTPPRRVAPLEHLNVRGLVAALDSPNGPQRDLAQQLLVTRRAADAAARLRKLARTSPHAAARVQALCTLEGLAALDADVLTLALDDADPSVRRHALRLSERFLASSPALVERILELAVDSDPQVQLQVAYSLGDVDDARAAQALAQLAWDHPTEPYVLAGVWSSVDATNAGAVVRHIFALAGDASIPETLLDPSIRLAIELGSPADIEAVAVAISSGAKGEASGSRLAAAARLLEQSGNRSRDASAHSSAIERQLAPMVAAAERMLVGDGASETEQLAAVRFLKASDAEPRRVVELAARLLAPQCSPAVQQAAVELIASCEAADAGGALLDAWTGFTPATRAVAFDALIGRPALVAQLLGRLADGALRPVDLDALQRQRLTSHADAALRAQAVAALTGSPQADRQAVVAEFLAQPVDGEAPRGRQAFDKHCASCHRLEGRGHEVGPDLAALTTRTRQALAESILDPNRAVDERFQSYTALTVDGQSHAGVLLAETSTSVTLVGQEGKTLTLLRSDLELLQNSGVSLMPEGFERDLSTRDLNDVIAYLAAMGPTRKVIEGSAPTVITPDYNGALWLLPSVAEVFGNHITFEPRFGNIGFWHDRTDHVAWTVQLPHDQNYDVYVRWACSQASAGNLLAVDGGRETLHWQVAATGANYDRYRTQKIGRLALAAGENRVVVRPQGALTKRNLIDLGGVYLLPEGSLEDANATPEPPPDGHDAATGVAKLLDGLHVGTEAEYERIPAIWELAIDAGRRNLAHELRRLLDLSLPKADEPLADWQAVVIGGGVVNGVSQAGAWPRRRLAEVIGDDEALAARWTRALELAKRMADDQSVRRGTRYDALRMLGADEFAAFGPQLTGYLAADANRELQMGAVSGLADMESPGAVDALIAAFAGLSGGNRGIAFQGLLRSPDRATALAKAIESGAVAAELLSAEQLRELNAALGRTNDGQ
jgi:putative membrane-bound dehydrogenase-like protein